MLFGVKLSHESGADSLGHGAGAPTFKNDCERGHREQKKVTKLSLHSGFKYHLR